ncbi:hypothetical protein EE612_003479, partial [Oryza sativa]
LHTSTSKTSSLSPPLFLRLLEPSLRRRRRPATESK